MPPRRTAENELPRIAREEAAAHHPFAIVDENLHAGAVDKDPQASRLAAPVAVMHLRRLQAAARQTQTVAIDGELQGA